MLKSDLIMIIATILCLTIAVTSLRHGDSAKELYAMRTGENQ